MQVECLAKLWSHVRCSMHSGQELKFRNKITHFVQIIWVFCMIVAMLLYLKKTIIRSSQIIDRDITMQSYGHA